MDVPETLRQALADRYAIERELGQGGMATVYLAEDLKHHRKVALKVLRPELAVTIGAGRFSREIEVAARLQHPNILPLLDSGEAAGFFFYVMPYVEGESLRERLARGGELPVQDAVRILMEVADALSEAHAHGVVHRDIKPDNVMLRGRHALVADFGVAKAVTEATGQQLLTSTGVALGTPTYMAPEQAMADPHQDHRVDIYALGVLGYELLTGRAPFSATTAQEMLAAHVTATPDPVEKYRATVSPALAAIVMKCLAKKPADRWQTAEEVLQHLEPLATPSGGTTPTQTQPTTAIGRLPRWAKWAAGAVALAVVAVVAAQLFRHRPLSITVSDIAPVSSEPGVEFQPAISPDGNEVAYVAGSIKSPRLVIRSSINVAGGGGVRLGDSVLGSQWIPGWSADGQTVRYLGCPSGTSMNDRRCSWWETGKLGGAVRSVTVPRRASGPVWAPDGLRVAFVRTGYGVGDTIVIATAADTAGRVVAVQRADFWSLHSLAWSPDGRRLAYVNSNTAWQWSGNVAPSSIWVLDVDGGEPGRVAGGEYLNVSPAWLDARHVLFVSNRDGPRAVYVVEVGPDGARGEPRIVPGVADPHAISYAIGARRLAYAKLTLRQNIWAYPLGGREPVSIGAGRPVTTGIQVIERHDVSPDGRWIAYDGNLRGRMELYKVPVVGGQPVRLTDHPADSYNPHWSPDGSTIAFEAVAGDSSPMGGARDEVMAVPADGGAAAQVTHSPGTDDSPAWSPDGLAIAFHSQRTEGRSRLWLLTRDSVRAPWHEPTPLTDFACYQPVWTPGRAGVLCTPDGGSLVLVSPQGRVLWRSEPRERSGLRLDGTSARYSRDGRTVYVPGRHQDGRQGIWAIPASGGAARLVIVYDDPTLNPTGSISVGPDHLYLTIAQYESDIWVMKLRR